MRWPSAKNAEMDFFSSSCKTDFQSAYKPTVSGWIEGGQNTGRMKMKMKTTFFFLHPFKQKINGIKIYLNICSYFRSLPKIDRLMCVFAQR